MSGGSYNYLFAKRAGEFRPDNEDFLAMLKRLEDLGAGAAATDTRRVLTMLTDLEDLLDVLGPVWKAVEWCDSSDSGPGAVTAAVARYEETASVINPASSD